MILESLEAENFQKYDRLDIRNLPSRGIIGILGENESGKSTLGEVIAFAFYGRTMRLDEDHMRDVISWNREQCKVRVGFRTPDGGSYRITRELDREGSYSAELEDARSGELLAKGIGRVNRKLNDLLPISFEEFRYSFYLGQKELDLLHDSSPEARRRLLDKMIGVNNIEEAAGRVDAQLQEFRAQMTALDEEMVVHREVSRQVRVDPKERDRVADSIRQQENQLATRTAELSRAAIELEEATQGCHAIGVSRALGLRAILRGYGVVFGRLAGWLRQAAGQLQTRLQTLERDAAAASTRLEDLRLLEAKRQELTGVMRVRQRELEEQLRNNLDADYRPEDAAFITPATKAEQLAFTKKKFEESVVELEQLRSRYRRRISMGSLLVVAGGALTYLWLAYSFVFFVVFGILYFLWGLLTWSRAGDAEERRARLSLNADRLSEDVGKCETSRQACIRFNSGNLAAMTDVVAQTGSEWAKELQRNVLSRFGELLNLPDGHGEELVGRVNSLREDAASVRRELAEIEVLVADLELELERLSRSGHARVVRPACPAGDTYKSGDVREWRARIRTMIDRSRKAQFQLEAAPAGVLDREFSEFETAAAKQPAVSGAALDVAALAELDSGTSSLEPTMLEQLLEREAAKLESLAGAGEGLASRTDGLSRRKQDLEVSASRTRMELDEARRELARIEPNIVRGAELDKLLSDLAARKVELQRRMQVHETLLDTFAQLRDHMRARFGPQLAEYISWVLPRLTGDRYRQVRVSPDLDVEVFSPDKQDFVPLSNMSGGTVDQLFLTLRLAFSKALLGTKLSTTVQQYLFFDEPLSSFDDKRGLSFLDLLKNFHGNFEQVFVVTHAQGIEPCFDRLVKTSLEARELISN
ncbi:MAG: SMC family ATPase [Candidatus Riflebacteria bacterium]|nr:SMC family ATPase [Candidatus Riflebacteria bacterium]